MAEQLGNTRFAKYFAWPKISERLVQQISSYVRDQQPLSIDDDEGVVSELEAELKRYFGCKYVLLFNSGTSALHAAYFGLALKRNSTVAAPVYTYPATVMPMLNLGLRPEFCDANPTTANVDPDAILRAARRGVAAIVVTHMWGLPCDMDAIRDIASHVGVPILEDISHAPGATYRGAKVGTLGQVAALSLQAFKLVWAGEGGALLTSEREIYERAVLFGHNQQRVCHLGSSSSYAQYAPYGYGLKLRIHPLAAVIGLDSARNLDRVVSKQQQQAAILNACFRDDSLFSAPPMKQDTKRVYYTYKPIATRKRQSTNQARQTFVDALRRRGIPARIPDSAPLARHPIFRDGLGELFQLPIAPVGADFPGASRFFETAVTIPFPNAASVTRTRSIAEVIAAALDECHIKGVPK